MHQDEPRWGEPPDEGMIAELLVERFPIARGERVTVQIDEEAHAVGLTMTTGKNVYRIRVAYLRGAGTRDPWFLLVDALDNLFGTFIESNRAYRELPSGIDTEFEGGFFHVTVEREVPALERQAQDLLKSGHSEEGSEEE